jgi:hypothetical protein
VITTATNPNALWIINMRRAPAVWTPEPWEIQYFQNPSYLNSLWIGIVWNVVLAPWRFMHEVLKTVFEGHLLMALILLVLLPISMVKLAFAGICGQVHAVRLPIDILLMSRLMTPSECEADIRDGPGLLIRPVEM